MSAPVVSLAAVRESRRRVALARRHHSAITRDASGHEGITIEPGVQRLAFDVPAPTAPESES